MQYHLFNKSEPSWIYLKSESWLNGRYGRYVEYENVSIWDSFTSFNLYIL